MWLLLLNHLPGVSGRWIVMVKGSALLAVPDIFVGKLIKAPKPWMIWQWALKDSNAEFEITNSEIIKKIIKTNSDKISKTEAVGCVSPHPLVR